MSKIETGGPAFPVSIPGWGDNGASGMTLRDHFAGLAMQGFVVRQSATFSDADTAAKFAYRYADAMLAARGGDRD